MMATCYCIDLLLSVDLFRFYTEGEQGTHMCPEYEHNLIQLSRAPSASQSTFLLPRPLLNDLELLILHVPAKQIHTTAPQLDFPAAPRVLPLVLYSRPTKSGIALWEVFLSFQIR